MLYRSDNNNAKQTVSRDKRDNKTDRHDGDRDTLPAPCKRIGMYTKSILLR